MASFAELRKKKNPLADMQAKMKKDDTGTSRNGIEDDTYWSMNHLRGEDGTGYATIRLLPAPENEDDPWVSFVEHIFQGREHWYVNRSRMSLGSNEKDPVYEFNGKIFRDKSLSDEAKKKKLLPRKQNYISNILVVDDPVKPENNGKVFRFKYGPQIFQIIQSAAFPEFGAKPVAVFDPFEGANLTIRVYTKKIGKDSVPSYEKSSFDAVSSIVENEDDFDAIWAKQYPLAEIVARDKFLPYAELKLRFDLVMGEIDEDDYERGLEKLKEGVMARENVKPKEKADARREKAAEPAKKSLSEEMNDDLPPFDEDDDGTEEAVSLVSSDEDDDADWFNNLKK